LAFLLGVLYALPVSAASFQVSPTRFEFPLTKRFTNFFTLTNNSGQSVRIRIYPKFIQFSPDRKIEEKVGHPLDLSRWMVFNPRLVNIRPKQKRTIRFSVRPPRDLSGGEYRAVIFFEEMPARAAAQPQQAQGESVKLQLKLLTRLGVTIYGMIGERNPQLQAGERRVRIEKDQLTVTAMVENTGNVHVSLNIKAQLQDESGDTLSENVQSFSIQREQNVRWSFATKKPEKGKFRLLVTGTGKEKQELLNFAIPIDVGAGQGS
ncbi:MAG: hypothetical protein O7A69_09650, partial [SAR324 cluster bacterium]|nr:hypothetical protein [SAR324 cluster bacterium]